jgi:hypothetical protein
VKAEPAKGMAAHPFATCGSSRWEALVPEVTPAMPARLEHDAPGLAKTG